MTAYYNENDPKAAAWLRELIKAGLIASGVVDERSILDVRPADLAGYTQCHFFAGIGIWSYALRLAGWPDDKPVWTGSCPCQSFSSAGKGLGFADERHLWPAWFHLIQQGKPADVPVFGEQVASDSALAWIDLVCADMENEGYTVWPVDTCAAGFGAPHIRQRLHWLAFPYNHEYCRTKRLFTGEKKNEAPRERARIVFSGHASRASVNLCWMEHARGTRLEGNGLSPILRKWQNDGKVECSARSGAIIGVDYSIGNGRQEGRLGDNAGDERIFIGTDDENVRLADPGSRGSAPRIPEQVEREKGISGIHDDGSREQSGSVAALERTCPGPTNGFWGIADWLYCRDGKWRPVEPSTFPLAYGVAGRVGLLRGYGNGLVLQQTQAFIEATGLI